MIITRLGTLVLFLVASTVGCSGDSDDDVDPGAGSSSGDSAAALPDPCSLLSAEEVESLLGAPIAGEPVSSGGSQRCSWERKYSPELRNDEIVLSIGPAAAYSSDGSTALVGASPYEIGDEGQLLDQSRGVQIAWKKGAFSASYRYSVVGAFTGDFEPLRARAKELAQAADGRM